MITTRVAWILVVAASVVTACSYSLPAVNAAGICGNDALEGEEQCDDGNHIDDDGCDSNCTATTCGNGIMTSTEECDDGNSEDGDGCTASCVISICSDGLVQPGEECDDENLQNGDQCEADCTKPRCGNAILDQNEVCDDGNVDNGDACDPTCSLKNDTSIFVGTPGVWGYDDGVGDQAKLSGRPFLSIHDGVMFMAGSNTVRGVNLKTREVMTIAGLGGTAGYDNQPDGLNSRFDALEGLATDGTTLWVSDGGNHVLRAVSLTGNHEVVTVAGAFAAPNVNVTSMDGNGLAAQFDDLRGLAYYNGLVYMLDADAAILQTFDPQSKDVKTVAGTAYQRSVTDGNGTNARFVSPRLMTSNGSGLLYIADADGRSIRVFNVATHEVTTIAGNGECGYVDNIGNSARLNRPRGITMDGQSLYFTEPHALTIRQVVLATQQVTTLSGTPDACIDDCSCPFDTLGSHLEGVGTAAQWDNPWDVAFDPMSKSLFVSDSDNYVIRRIR